MFINLYFRLPEITAHCSLYKGCLKTIPLYQRLSALRWAGKPTLQLI
ncbi:MAG: hypothetical protein J5680_05465 [Neisseriaceae bacterium]|nr:hypothetical protein [Neisseriaceae bacterium]